MNKNRTLKLVSLFLILSLALTSVSSSIAAPPPPEDVTFETISLPPEAQSASDGSTANARASSNPKLDSTMAGLAAAARISTQEAINLAQSQSLRLSGNRVHVQIVTHAPGLENAVEAIKASGGEITGIGNDDTLIQGWLPIGVLENVAAHNDVYLVRRPAEVVLWEDLYAGNSTTEGLAVINGPAWHTAGYTGSGVKVAIIDGGFLGYTSLLGTDLPASVTVKNFVDGENDSQVDGTSEHGTACAEIIHDIAPDATLYLVKISTNLDLAEAVAWVKDTHHVDIISTSLGWYNVTPGDGTGEFADLVQDARNDGILWATAASNDREAHWGGLYSDPDADNTHNFNGDQEINFFGPGDDSYYPISAGYSIMVFLRWDDWTNVNQDYDLYLLRWNGASWDTVAAGEDVQNGSPGQTPTESAYAVTSGTDTAYGFIIVRYSSTRNVNFEVFVPKVAPLDELLHARSLGNLADAPDAMTVAALDVTSPYSQESYSSEGPTNGPGGAETGGLTKPDISGFANVATESYTGSSFNGTSAATPHVAGAAALVLSANPSYTPDQTQSFLEERAVDMGSTGMDTLYGYGRLHLGDPAGGTNTAPTISGLPDQSLPVNTSLDNAIDLWAYASDTEDIDADLTFSIDDVSAPDAGVSIDGNHYIDINPITDWTGQADVTVRVTDSGGLYDTDIFRVTVTAAADKTWDGSTSSDWHTADNWTPSGAPTSGDDVLIPNVSNDPIISSSDAAVDSLTVNAGAVLDLTDRALTVEGTLSNNGTLKQTLGVSAGSDTEFLRITNLAGTQAKYYGVDITPSGTAFTAFETNKAAETFAAQSLESSDLPMPAAPLADVELILDDGTQESNLVLRDPNTLTEFHAVLFNHFAATMVSGFPFTLERIDIHENTNNLQGEDIQLLVYTDADGGDPGNATLLYSEIVTVQTQLGWNVYTLTNPVVISNSADILVGFSTYYADGGVPWPFENRYPYPMDTTDPQGRSYLAWMNETSDPVDPSDLSSFPNLRETGSLGSEFAANWLIRGYGSMGTLNTSPIISGLPDQTVPTNGSADDAIDLWTYASDTEDASDVMTYTISNSPTISAGVTIDSNHYIDINPTTGWAGVTDVEIQVQDTGGLTDTDTFQVTVSDAPDIDISPTSFEETLAVDEVFTATLTISNTGTASLSFWFDTVGVSWLSVDPGGGGVASGASQLVDVIFDAAGQSLGDYNTNLVINSNDPDENPVTVPVVMHVAETLNTPPAISGLPDLTVPVNGSLSVPVDLWAYASDDEDASDVMTYTISNSPDPNAGVNVDSNRYLEINPATDWTGVTDVEIQVQDTGGLTDTDTFRVTVGDVPNIKVTPASLEETLAVGEVFTATLTISNTGTASLSFWFDTVGVSWLSVDPGGGGVTGGDAQLVDVVFDATGQSPGDYNTNLVINSSGEDPVTVPVTMTVTDSGTITNVTVSVSGNQFCAGRTTGVKRCFDITPAAALEATVCFYLSEAERNGLTLSDLRVFHYDGDWTEEPGSHASGGAGDAQYVQAQNIDDFSLFALDKADYGGTVYLPIVLKHYPPVPSAPTLNAISNSDGDGNYNVSWSAVDLADTYTLQEDDNPSFSSPTMRSSDSSTSWSASGKAAGTYYYRVKAINNWEGQQLESGWSNVRSVYVGPPGTPVLNDISNSDGNGSYTVSWNATNLAETYTLQEDDNAAFSNPITVYSESGTSKSITGRGVGTYYYRVRASNGSGNSGWSNTRSVVVTVPLPPCEQHDFGVPGTQYYIYPSGRSWNFTADSDMAVRSVQVKSVLATSSGHTFSIQVKINDSTVASWSQYVNNTAYEDFYHSKDVSFDMHTGDKITYRISINSGVGGLAWMNYVKLCR